MIAFSCPGDATLPSFLSIGSSDKAATPSAIASGGGGVDELEDIVKKLKILDVCFGWKIRSGANGRERSLGRIAGPSQELYSSRVQRGSESHRVSGVPCLWFVLGPSHRLVPVMEVPVVGTACVPPFPP